MEISIVDATLCFDSSGEPRINLGDVTSGVGFTASAPLFGSGDGFVGVPNGPDDSNQAPQAIQGTQGLYRIALAIRDPRFAAKVGALAEGDRAIVSNCDAGLLLKKSANTIALVALAQGLSIELNAATGTLTLTTPTSSVTVGSNGVVAQYSSGGVLAEAAITSASLGLNYSAPGVNAGVVVGPAGGGSVAIACATGQFTVNGVPVIVP